MEIPFVSRHKISEAQIVTLKKRFPSAVINTYDIRFKGLPKDQLKEVGIDSIKHPAIALVAPSWVVADLLNGGFRVIVFKNAFFSRELGIYICAGAAAMKLTKDKGILIEHMHCPVPQHDQVGSTSEKIKCCKCGRDTYKTDRGKVTYLDPKTKEIKEVYMCTWCTGDAKYNLEKAKEV